MKTRLERGKNMKKKKGFTLIELLAVIVILAIIALIAVPVVMNIISKANKSAFKDSAYGVLKAGENYYMGELLKAEGMSKDKTFTFPGDNADLEINGSKPTGGYMTVNKDGKISMAIHNGKHCVIKGFEDDDVTISDDVENCGVTKEYAVGDVVYYNPVEDKICTDYVGANSVLGVKEGCMRWYVYAIDGRNAKLILDHNTTAYVVWGDELNTSEPVIPQSSQSEQKYVPNTLINKTNGISKSTLKTMANSIEATTLMEQLGEDTTDWKVQASIITLEEVMNLMPYYQKLSPNEKQAFLNDDEEVIGEYFDVLEAADNDAFENIPGKGIEVLKDRNEYFVENYSDLVLPSYMYEDIFGTCENVDDYADCGTHGYWARTATAVNNFDQAWHVDNRGSVSIMDVHDNSYGVRPVITLSK